MAEEITRRNLLEKVIVGGLIGGLGLASLVGCKDKGVVKKEEFTLYVSQTTRGTGSPMYCGMPNEKHFSLSWQYYNATNLYYPKDTKQINFFNDVYEVVSVDPNKITLRKIKK